ncbi:NAD-dependent epimerase/dehydratase family protein [Paracoccus benzoatiresistens]|uniref:UDP-glucose 4-epimerase n=1 Tax=Paracoccus benzoatiresistens TaxID=2997341 RepID=A0ABT4J8T6_9RHOB|nr:NAD-dependent epimerase/dehydratase family protein [Paracoccus sp. EF6]MCZ0963547.1 NAD-dependent epimerase/dehydratase family protein [Paracoccus sp. EF6]
MHHVLVVGGCGFIGSHIVDSLLAQGHRVRVLDMRPEAFRPPLPGVDYVIGSFASEATLHEALQGVDAVVHTASITVPSTSNADPVADIQGNLVATVRMLRVMRQAGVRKLVFLSSGGTVYGIPTAEVVDESHPLAPISSYGIVKVAIEQYLHMEHRLHGLDYIALRLANPYGPRQGYNGIQGIIGNFLWKIAFGEPIEVWGDGSVVRDFIHVHDFAELCALAVKAPIIGCFNAGSGQGASVNEIVQAASQVANCRVRPIYKPGRSFDVPRVILDISRIKQAIGWAPRIPLIEGMRQSWDWIQEHQAIDNIA